MQKIERINSNITIACSFEQLPERPTEESRLIRRVTKLSFNPRDVLLYRDLRVQHIRLCELDCTHRLQHAVYVAWRRFDFEVLQNRAAYHRVEHTFTIAQCVGILDLILNIWRGTVGLGDFQKLG